MSDGDIYIKNPMRNRKVSHREPYVPEYKKLGVTPIEYPGLDEQEQIRNGIAKLKEEKIEEPKSLMEQLKSGEISPEQKEEATIKHGSYGLVSGQSSQTLWTEGLEEPKSEPKEEEKSILTDKSYNDTIRVEEVPSPPESYISKEVQEEVQEVEEEMQDDDVFSFSNVKESEYVLIYNDGVVGFGEESEIRELISEVVINDQVKVEDLVLVKRSSLKMGILIDG